MDVIGAYPWMYPWLLARLDAQATPHFRAIAAVDGKHEIKGMVGYDHWTANSVVMSIALDTPMAFKYLLPIAFRYPFEREGRKIALVFVREENKRSRKLVEHVGFKEVYRVKDGIKDGEDQIVFELRRENCKYLGATNGQG